MSAAPLLERLEGVRQTGPGRWLARCPSHADRCPSLSIREVGDGRILVHDFGGCRVEDVLQAINLHWSALFSDRDWAGKQYRKAAGIPASDILKALDFESLVVSIVASDMREKRAISETDLERLELARKRIAAARSSYGR